MSRTRPAATDRPDDEDADWSGDEWAGDEDADWSGDDEPAGDEDADWGDGGGGAVWTAADDAPVDHDHLAALRTVRLVVVALVLAVVGLGAVALAGAVDDDDGDRADDPTLGEIPVVVGPPSGAAIADYVAGRQAELATAEGRRVAVVSLVGYRSASSVDEILAGVGDVDVVARLVALPGGPATPIELPVAEWIAEQRAPLQAERDEIAGILPTIEDPDDPFIPGYTEDLARLDAQLAALDPNGELVAGLVVQADADALRRLAERADVRLVDVGPDDDVDDLSSYRGLRPEEVDVAGMPLTRPLPVPA